MSNAATFVRVLSRFGLSSLEPRFSCFHSRHASSSSKEQKGLGSRDHWIAAADEGRTLVLYHPERPFPYEHSLPIPRQQALINEGDSVLKVQHRVEMLEAEILQEKTPMNIKLSRMFGTRAARFLPTFPANLYRRFRVKNPPKGRDGM